MCPISKLRDTISFLVPESLFVISATSNHWRFSLVLFFFFLNANDVVEDVYLPDKAREGQKVFGSNDYDHPAVNYLHFKAKEFYVGGKVQVINRPNHYDYIENRCSSFL